MKASCVVRPASALDRSNASPRLHGRSRRLDERAGERDDGVEIGDDGHQPPQPAGVRLRRLDDLEDDRAEAAEALTDGLARLADTAEGQADRLKRRGRRVELRGEHDDVIDARAPLACAAVAAGAPVGAISDSLRAWLSPGASATCQPVIPRPGPPRSTVTPPICTRPSGGTVKPNARQRSGGSATASEVRAGRGPRGSVTCRSCQTTGSQGSGPVRPRPRAARARGRPR